MSAELSYDLGGVRAQWRRAGADRDEWSGWLPHIDTNVNNAMTAGSAEHDRLRTLLKQPGRLTMKSQLLLPGNKVQLQFQSSGKFALECETQKSVSQKEGVRHVAKFTVTALSPRQEVDPRGGRQQVLPSELQPLRFAVETGGDLAAIAARILATASTALPKL